MSIQNFTLSVPEIEKPIRLDAFVVANTSDLSRSRIAELIDEGLIKVDGANARRSRKLRGDEKISIEIPPPKTCELKPVKIPFEIIFDDEHIAVINKPAGLIVHPAGTTDEITLVHGLLYQFPKIAEMNEDERPGVVHRLDKDTSGCMIIAKTEKARLRLIEMFSNHEIKKEYYTLVKNVPRENKFEINKEIGRSSHDRKKMSVNSKKGRPAKTIVTLAEQFDDFASALSVNIITGRTHQIRVHLADCGLPVIGDLTYGKAAKILTRDTEAKRQMLHARKISFAHPVTEKPLIFKAKIPDDIVAVRHKLLEMTTSANRQPVIDNR